MHEAVAQPHDPTVAGEAELGLVPLIALLGDGEQVLAARLDEADGPAQLAAAFSPNPKNPPDYFDTPFKDGEPQPLILAKWAANSPLAMIDQYVTNLKKYHAIMGDFGLQDAGPGIVATNKQMDQILTDFGVTHTFETYEGDHTSRVPERIEQKVLPFFSSNLSFTAPKR